MSVRTRVRQFTHALAAPFFPLNHDEIDSLLSPELAALFYQLSPSERSHSVRVLQALKARGDQNRDLLAAALLHDVGKSRFRLRLYERVLVVLLRHLNPRKQTADHVARPGRWTRMWQVAQEHPQWGADMVSEAGASELLIWLVRNHQKELTGEQHEYKEQLLAALQAADKEN